MRKTLPYLFAALFLLAAHVRVHAQEGFHLGIFAQPQSTWIFNTEDTDVSRSSFSYKSTWGYAGMAKIGYNIGDPLGFHLGLIYSMQGQKHTSIDSLGTSILSQRLLSYIKIPLLLHINSDPARVMFNFEFGPQIGFLRTAELFEDGQALNLPYDAVNLYKPNDISVAWSIGAQFNLTEVISFVLVHRGDYGVVDMENKGFTWNSLPYYDGGRVITRNATFGLMGGFNFCFAPGRGGGRRGTQFWFR
jgi:Outer membrane protein beta-barrel domain